MHRRTVTIALATAGGLAVPTAASAHVTLQPKEATAGAYTVENVRVPNEKEDASTTRVDLQLPDGFASVSYAAVPGWKVDVRSEKLDTPITTAHGDKITEQVNRIVFSGGKIAPGQFQDFPLSLQIPEAAAGKALTFKALQTYSDGEVVRWIGTPDSERPAPTIEVAAATQEEDTAAPASPAAPAQPAAAVTQSDDGDGNGLAVAALIVGALGLLAGGAGLYAARRPRA